MDSTATIQSNFLPTIIHEQTAVSKERIRGSVIGSYVIFTYTSSDLIDSNPKALAIKNKLLTFKKLKANWDGYGAKKINTETVDKAVFFISKNFVSNQTPTYVGPTPDGGVVIEYDNKEFKLTYRFVSEKKYLTVIKNRTKVISNFEVRSNADTYLNPNLVFKLIALGKNG